MKVSFVVPAHNEELRIAACIEAAQAEIDRSKREAEIIVVDNASTDKTGDIVRSLPNVRFVEEPRKGLSRARQSGFEASSGELIANIDADTMVPPGWLDTVARSFERDEKLVALSGPFFYFDLPLHRRALIRLFYIAGYTFYLLNRFVLNNGSMLQGGNFIIRRSALVKIGGFDDAFHFYGEDTDVARRLHKVGKVRWTFTLPMPASGRRIAHEGMVRMGLRYAINYVWTTFFGKAWSKEYVDIRTDWQKRHVR